MADQHMGDTVKLIGAMMRLRHNTKFNVSVIIERRGLDTLLDNCCCYEGNRHTSRYRLLLLYLLLSLCIWSTTSVFDAL